MSNAAVSRQASSDALPARTFIGGEWRDSENYRTIVDPYRGEIVGEVAIADHADWDAAIAAAVAAKQYGLQCGLFTRSNEMTFRAIRELRTGAIIVNGSSTWRTDQLAYGGIKSSGIGREGPRYAIREMTEERLVAFNL